MVSLLGFSSLLQTPVTTQPFSSARILEDLILLTFFMVSGQVGRCFLARRILERPKKKRPMFLDDPLALKQTGYCTVSQRDKNVACWGIVPLPVSCGGLVDHGVHQQRCPVGRPQKRSSLMPPRFAISAWIWQLQNTGDKRSAYCLRAYARYS
jgi:hypothetical protein